MARDYYTNVPKDSGIYMWYNRVNGKKYIGSAKNLFNRVGTHLRQMRSGKNDCGMLQVAYNKYGEDNLIFVVITLCSEESLLKTEQYFLDEMKPEYNKRLVAYSNAGLKFGDETRKKHSQHSRKRFPVEMIEEMKELRCKYIGGTLVSPKGERYMDVDNLRQFSISVGIDPRRFWDIIKGRKKSYKGWTFVMGGI